MSVAPNPSEYVDTFYVVDGKILGAAVTEDLADGDLIDMRPYEYVMVLVCMHSIVGAAQTNLYTNTVNASAGQTALTDKTFQWSGGADNNMQVAYINVNSIPGQFLNVEVTTATSAIITVIVQGFKTSRIGLDTTPELTLIPVINVS